MKKYNIGIGVFFLILAIAAYAKASTMVAMVNTDNLGPAFWPKCLSILIGLLSIAQVVEALVSKKYAQMPAPVDFRSEGIKRVLKVSGVLIVFGVITGILGIYVGLVFLLPVSMYLLGERNKKIMALLTAAFCLGVFVIFGILLKVPLPTGLFFD